MIAVFPFYTDTHNERVEFVGLGLDSKITSHKSSTGATIRAQADIYTLLVSQATKNTKNILNIAELTLLLASKFAPASVRYCATINWPFEAAKIRAVLPFCKSKQTFA